MMLRKPSYRDHKTGKRTPSANWEIRLRIGGRLCSISAFKDRAASLELGRKVERLAALRAAGQLPDPALQRWLDALPHNIAQRLARLDLLDTERIEALKPLDEHLDDWRADLAARRTLKYARHTHATVKALFAACRFRYHSDIRPQAVQAELNRRHGEDGSSARTYNFAMTSSKTFCNWMARNGRATVNPLAWLSGLNAGADQRRKRRALTAAECRYLLDFVAHAPRRRSLSGPDRALLYRLALETGLRRNELACLRVCDLDLERATVTVQAAFSKHRRQDVIPLRPGLIELLRAHLVGKPLLASVFGITRWVRTWEILKADMDGARAAWIEQGGDSGGDFLRFTDSTGRTADFHGLRHTFISHLAAGGVHPKTAQSLARHSDINLTMSVYTHTLLNVEREALAKLPDLSTPSLLRKAE